MFSFQCTYIYDNEVFRKPIAFSCGLETQTNGQLLSNCQTNELQSLVGDSIFSIKKQVFIVQKTPNSRINSRVCSFGIESKKIQ